MGRLITIADNSLLLRPPGCEGIQIFGGRMAKTTTLAGSGKTYEFSAELMARSYDSVGYLRCIVGAALISGYPADIAAAGVKMLGAFADADSAYPANVTWSGLARGRVKYAGSVIRRNYAWSDATEITPVARTDGRSRPLASGRLMLTSGVSQTIYLLGNDPGTDVYTNWPARAAGQAQIRLTAAGGDQTQVTSGFSTASNSAFVGFAFSHLGRVINVASIGDSIAEGRGTYIGASFGLRACEMINAEGHATYFVHSGLAYSGQTTSSFVSHVADMIRDGVIPDILLAPLFSPNDSAAGVLTDAQLLMQKARVSEILAYCGQYNITPIFWTGLPCNTAVNPWLTTDALRIAYNAAMMAGLRAAGVTVVDLAVLFNGAVSGGQIQLNAALSNDQIHPNDAGIEVGAAAVAAAIKTVVGGYLDATA